MVNDSENLGVGKIAYFMIASVILLGFTFSEFPLNDLERQHIKGKVMSILETRTGNPSSDTEGAEDKISYQKLSKYNDRGFETQATILNSNGKSSALYYTFDTAGYQTGLKEYTEDGTLWSTVTYKLDSKHYRCEAVYEWQDRGGYDEIREKSEQLYELLDRNPWDKVIYQNEFRGLATEEKYTKNEDVLLFKFTYRYDNLGRKVEMTYFNSKGRTSWVTKYKYDRNNNLIQSVVYKSNRVAARSVYKHEFDSRGNWVRRTEQREVEYNILTANLVAGNFVTERVIEYYP